MIRGKIFDTQDAVIPGAEVKTINGMTGDIFEAKSDEEGIYRVAAPRTGEYRLKVHMNGFSPYEMTGDRLRTGRETKVDVHLNVVFVGEVVAAPYDKPDNVVVRVLTLAIKAGAEAEREKN